MSDRASRDTDRDNALDEHEPRSSEDRETRRDLVATGGPEARGAKSRQASEAGVHRVAVETAILAVIWFIAVTWATFAAGPEIDYLLVIVTLFFAMFFVLFLLTASYTLHDSRWPASDRSFREFLKSRVGIGGETMRGREVIIEIAILPVSLAFAATLIGLVRYFAH